MNKKYIFSFVRYFTVRNFSGRNRTLPDFSKNTYNIKRGEYNSLNEKHVTFFSNLLSINRTVSNEDDLERYNVDFFKHFRGSSPLVLKPKTREEVSEILSYCNDNKLAVCPQGGNTGVAGGCTPVFDEIIVSTELMNKIIHVDDTAGSLLCEAGCVLETLERRLDEHELYLPIDLGAKGSCHIGGNVSTNAGGLRLLRYGNLHGNVLGIEAVLADGRTIDCLSNSLQKDNTGYHLKHLFIGSEGTLGFVTKVSIRCYPKPKSVSVALLGAESFDKVLTIFAAAKRNLAEILSAFEMMDDATLQFLYQHQRIRAPIGSGFPFYVLLETSGSDPNHDERKLNRFTEMCFSNGYILNGCIATDQRKYLDIWSIRERIAENFVKDGYVFTYDFTLPVQHYYALVPEMRRYMDGRAHRVFGFGHLGDGNLHLQISVKEFDERVKAHLEPYVFEKVIELGGSISAEHGMGINKSQYLHMCKSEANVNLMKQFKILLDPNGIMNPYKVLS